MRSSSQCRRASFRPRFPPKIPPTAAKVSLGQNLYFDTRLSTDGTVACVSCHDPRHAFADGRGKRTSAGVGGALGTRVGGELPRTGSST
jgi:cytochrome c peroxidase